MEETLQFIDRARFMGSSLSNLVNNLSGGIHNVKCKFRHDDRKCETCGIKYKYCDCFLECINLKDDLIEYKCLCCNKNYQREFNEKLQERFLIHTNFLATTILSLFFCYEKVLPNHYEYTDNWEKSKETSLSEKGDIYSRLNMEAITDTDYEHAKRVCKDFEIKNLGEYHNF